MLPKGTWFRRWIWALIGGALLLGAGTAVLLQRHLSGRPIRILVIVSRPDSGTGMAPREARAVTTLLLEHLESLTPLSVTTLMEMPAQPIKAPGHWLLCQMEPSRAGDLLALRYRWAWSERLTGESFPWTERVLSARSPVEVAREFADGMPLKERRKIPVRSVPRDPKNFWSLVQAMAWRTGETRQQDAQILAGSVARTEPDCVSAWVTYGNLLFRNIMDIPERDRQAQQFEAEANLLRALKLVPGHPRGTMLLAELKTGSGNPREALDLILAALRERPGNPVLLSGFARTARTAGLLDLARRANTLRLRNTFPELGPSGGEKLFLYSGEWDLFEEGLKDRPGGLPTAMTPFLRGYMAVLKGRNSEALDEFRNSEAVPNGTWQIVALARVFRLALQQNRPEALKGLDELGKAVTRTRICDPELTLQLAEAYAFLDRPQVAMEMAERAFTQGFGCQEWYERSPLLAPLRSNPRWRFLLQHLQERHGLLVAHFPVSVLPE